MFNILSCIFFIRKYWIIYLHDLIMLFESKVRNNENINLVMYIQNLVMYIVHLVMYTL